MGSATASGDQDRGVASTARLLQQLAVIQTEEERREDDQLREQLRDKLRALLAEKGSGEIDQLQERLSTASEWAMTMVVLRLLRVLWAEQESKEQRGSQHARLTLRSASRHVVPPAPSSRR